MRVRIAIPEEHVHPDVVDAALESVTRLDEHMIRSGQTPTSHELIAAGAIWRPENMGDEHFDHGGTIAARGWGDCDDWAPLHAATLRADGTDPGARAEVIPSGPTTYHAIVRRSDGSIDDPSIAAGMSAPRNVSGENIEAYALDPHDGRVYHGQLVPSTAPLSLHVGVGYAVRGCHVVGEGMLFEGRCDVPLNGSPLVHVHAYTRHRPRGRRGVHGVTVVGGMLPYALSVTAHGASPQQALSRALVGAICCGDAAELPSSLDRYKMLAMQAALTGASPGEVREALAAAMVQDAHAAAAATGGDPRDHILALHEQLAAEGVIAGGYVVGDFFSDIGHAASAVVSVVSSAVDDVAKVANIVPWGDIIHGVQAAVSVIPGLGTAVSDVVAAAETAYESAVALLHGNPLEAAIDAAYNFATATVPGADAIRWVLDPVVATLVGLTARHEPVDSAVLDGILKAVPDVPNIGGISPRSIAASIAHLIVNHLGVRHTQPSAQSAAVVKAAVKAVPPHAAALHLPPLQVRPVRPVALTAAQHAAATRRTAQASARRKATPKPALHLPALHVPTTAKPLGVPHAAVHVSQAPALVAAMRPKPGSPGAPPGATHWASKRMPDGTWLGRWV